MKKTPAPATKKRVVKPKPQQDMATRKNVLMYTNLPGEIVSSVDRHQKKAGFKSRKAAFIDLLKAGLKATRQAPTQTTTRGTTAPKKKG